MYVGPWQLVLILIIIMVIFGAGKLPKVMGDFGKGINSFKKGLKENEDGQITNKENKAEGDEAN